MDSFMHLYFHAYKAQNILFVGIFPFSAYFYPHYIIR